MPDRAFWGFFTASSSPCGEIQRWYPSIDARRQEGRPKRSPGHPPLGEFERLFKCLLRAEQTELPDLEGALDSLLNDLEDEHQYRYNRREFKRYLMIPNTRQNGPV